MNEEQIRAILIDCLGAVANERPALVTAFARENAVAFRLGVHLANRTEFAAFNVDSEYDREGMDNDPKTRPNGEEIRPDIIVHNRGNNDANLLAIEVKWQRTRNGRSNNAAIEEDRNVLRDIKTRYGYTFCVLIILPRDLNNFTSANNIEFIP